jgi:hypothetical protein
MTRYLCAAALIVVLVALTRGNHATLHLAVLASSAFVLSADLGERASRRMASGLALKVIAFFGVAAFCGVVSALLISVAYDRVVGPDPLRFGLATNIVMDTTIIGLLMGLFRLSSWRLGKRSEGGD